MVRGFAHPGNVKLRPLNTTLHWRLVLVEHFLCMIVQGLLIRLRFVQLGIQLDFINLLNGLVGVFDDPNVAIFVHKRVSPLKPIFEIRFYSAVSSGNIGDVRDAPVVVMHTAGLQGEGATIRQPRV